jgi:type IV pilus assembly protein PilE
MQNAHAVYRRATAGFTLLEVMITVAIIGLLASVAVPSYTSYVRRGQLSEAGTYLSDYRVKMEQYYQDNKNYGATAGTVCATDATASTWNGFSPGAKYFTFSCLTSSSGQAYTLTAAGSGGNTTGYDYTINQAGNKGTTKYAGTTTTANCWMTKSSTSCD